MGLKAIFAGALAGGSAYLLLQAAKFGGVDTSAKVVYVTQPAQAPAQAQNGASKAAGWFNVALGLADAFKGGGPLFGGSGIAAGGDSLPEILSASYTKSGASNSPNFAEYEGRYSLPAGYLGRTAQIESGGNPAAKNPRSSAGGLFQFIDSTARQYGLVDRFDAGQATDAASRLASDNARQLRKALGRDPSGAELYLAHQQGGTGAKRLLANPTARASDIVGSDAVRLNGGTASMTSGEFAGLWINKYNGGI
jgi:hypothetical protein